MILKSKSADQTKKIAGEIVKKYLKDFRVFTLSGELGVGKTTFVQGFAKALNLKDKIISPTFVIIRQHKIPKTNKTLYHIDLYRVDDTTHLGLEELFVNPNAILLIEWPEKLTQKLPKDSVKISIKKAEGNERIILVN